MIIYNFWGIPLTPLALRYVSYAIFTFFPPFIQLFLSTRKNKYLGLILPGIALILAGVITVHTAFQVFGFAEGIGKFLCQVILAYLFACIPFVLYLVIYFICQRHMQKKNQLNQTLIHDLDL